MAHEVIDETNGPGRPLSSDERSTMILREVWMELGHRDGRVPTLDELLVEIRDLRDGADCLEEEVQGNTADPVVRHADITDLVAEDGPVVPMVAYGPFGLTITGYSAEDVMRIREHSLRIGKELKA